MPPSQAYQLWHALKTLGVETRLVIFPGEGHGLSPKARATAYESTADWFERHLSASP